MNGSRVKLLLTLLALLTGLSGGDGLRVGAAAAGADNVRVLAALVERADAAASIPAVQRARTPRGAAGQRVAAVLPAPIIGLNRLAIPTRADRARD